MLDQSTTETGSHREFWGIFNSAHQLRHNPDSLVHSNPQTPK